VISSVRNPYWQMTRQWPCERSCVVGFSSRRRRDSRRPQKGALSHLTSSEHDFGRVGYPTNCPSSRTEKWRLLTSWDNLFSFSISFNLVKLNGQNHKSSTNCPIIQMEVKSRGGVTTQAHGRRRRPVKRLVSILYFQFKPFMRGLKSEQFIKP
jgi:hypothetical protein